jgi:hypothetical protein
MNRRRIFVTGACLGIVALAFVAWQAYMPARRARLAHDAIQPGMSCAEALASVHPYVDVRRYEEDARACQSMGPGAYSGFSPTFTSLVTMTYTFEVKFDSQGRVREVSPIGAW